MSQEGWKSFWFCEHASVFDSVGDGIGLASSLGVAAIEDLTDYFARLDEISKSCARGMEKGLG